jgi:Fanconi-associated nuclease 1
VLNKSSSTGTTRKVITKHQPIKQKFVQQHLDFVDITEEEEEVEEEEEEEETLEIEENEIYYEYIDNYHFHHFSVRSFEEAIRTILQSEYYLFLDEEIQWWKNYTNLSCKLKIIILYALLIYSLVSCKHLFVRLYIRKYSWVRQSKLQKFIPVCENLNECIEELLKSALIHEAEFEDIVLEDALKELTLAELKEVVKGTLAKKVSLNGTKSRIIASVLRVVEKLPNYPKFGVSTKNHLEISIIEACLKVGGRFVAVDKEVWTFFDLVYRVFTHYGERYGQNVIRESIRTKAENINFMNYHISRSGNIFPNRQSLMSYDGAIDHIVRFTFTYYSSSASWIKHQNIVKSIEPIVKIWRSEIKLDYSNYPSSYFLRFTPAHAYTKLISTYYVPSLAALELYTEEAEILADLLDQTKFLQSERGKWWSRLSLLQDQYLSKDNVKFRNLAYANCINALRETIGNGIDSESATELYDRMIVIENQLKLVKRESRKLKDLRPPSIDIITLVNDEAYRAETNAIGKTQLVIRASKKKLTPEEYALQHFKQEGWKSYHSEVEILTTIFALTFLDILFLPLPGVFETPFQTHPLDLGTEVFYKSRKFYIDTRLKEIESEDFEHYLQTHYTEQYSKRTNVIGLSWEFGLDDLIEISDCIGGAALSRIFKLFCHDYFSYNAGMPDLW